MTLFPFQITNSKTQKGVHNEAFEVEKGEEPWMNNYVPYGKFPSGSPLDSVTFTEDKKENSNYECNEINVDNHANFEKQENGQ